MPKELLTDTRVKAAPLSFQRHPRAMGHPMRGLVPARDAHRPKVVDGALHATRRH